SAPAARSAIAGRPAEAVRRTLSEHRSAAARKDAAGAAPSPAPASSPAAPPPPVPVPDLAEMQPKTPTEVVDWAGRHLGLDRSFVVARAVDLEPDQERRREPVQLRALWKDLVAHVTSATVEADRAGSGSLVEADRAGSGSAVDAPPEEAETVDGFDLADLDDLAEAPSHAHDIEQKIKATFPGAELTMLPEPEGDDTGGEA
ncbi:MAG: hypothetical protein J4F50_01405, partial [Acidimicrobiia bacterium]|nr:hypothetical protein [Acidimicrobiia bacterium]